jgi:hypothetical protein
MAGAVIAKPYQHCRPSRCDNSFRLPRTTMPPIKTQTARKAKPKDG